jgi:hypothetical protein
MTRQFTIPRPSRETVLLIISIAAITLSLSIMIPMLLERTSNLNFPSVGTIHTIGVRAYYDPNLQNETRQVKWGTIYPGSSTNITLYLKSVSNIKTIFRLQTANWTFLNASNAIVSGPSNTILYLNLTWNYNNTAINPDQTIPVTLTLSVVNSQTFTQFLVSNDVTNFSFDIIINAEKL